MRGEQRKKAIDALKVFCLRFLGSSSGKGSTVYH
jgi:hypothetical protein